VSQQRPSWRVFSFTSFSSTFTEEPDTCGIAARESGSLFCSSSFLNIFRSYLPL